MTTLHGRRARFTLLALLAVITAATRPASARESRAIDFGETREIAVPDPSLVIHGGAAAHGALGRAVTDSFNIYGGYRLDGSNDRRPEGQFQDFILFPKEQGWTSIDLTEKPTFWNISTFNAENITPGQPNNRAYWSGLPAGTPGWATAPGYGNDWNDILQWTAEANPTVNTTVRLTFDFHHDVEPGYDFFVVEYDSAGTWVPFQAYTGSNKDGSNQFLTPVSFDETVVFTPLMYSGTSGRDVRLRMRAISDVAYSDEDGLYSSRGAVQVDNITVTFDGQPRITTGDDGTATFESIGPDEDDTEGWQPIAGDFAGDFAKVLIQLRDIDPCRDNLTPQLSFIDDGSEPKNAPGETTGGSSSPNWSYGVLGSYTVNYTGGITDGLVPISNEWWSPEIAWDDTTSTEDDALEGGALIRFGVWQHLPLSNGIFWTWAVRSSTDVGGDIVWTPWNDRGFVYYGDGGGSYLNAQFVVTDLLAPDPEAVQLAFGMVDLADAFQFPGTDGTPSPTFDNVSVWRFQAPGPAFSARQIDLFQDGFPNSLAIDPLNPTNLSVRMDAALDINPQGTNIVPGDSIVVDVTAAIPGTTLDGPPVMKWVLEANPYFDTTRSLPAGATNMGPGARGWTRWMGTVQGDSARTTGGTAVPDRFFFDLPNDGPALLDAPHQTAEPAMFFPGDVIRYFIEATDTGGNTASLPADTTGFLGSQARYSRVFTVRALPTIEDANGNQPEILVYNDFGHRGGENDFISAFDQIGMRESIDFDVYTTKGPSSLVSNGIGSAGAGGAIGEQLRGYSTIIYLAGDLQSGLISDGSNDNGNDKGFDTNTLQSWTTSTGGIDRNLILFGDNVSSFLASSGPTNLNFLSTFLGVDVIGPSVRSELGGLSTPKVTPSPAGISRGLTEPILAFGGCVGLNQFDSIRPQAASELLYDMVEPEFGSLFEPAGAVLFEEEIPDGQGGSTFIRRITFPFGFNVTYNLPNVAAPNSISQRSLFLKDLLESLIGPVGDPGLVTSTDTPRRFRVEANVPNPFNPSTEIAFSAPRTGEVRVRVFNLRGELVKTLQDGRVEAGEHSVQWNGTDESGASVASGIYLYRVDGFGESVSRKMTLVK